MCSLHLGIAEGVAELAGGRVVVDELVPHDPGPRELSLAAAPGPDKKPEARTFCAGRALKCAVNVGAIGSRLDIRG